MRAAFATLSSRLISRPSEIRMMKGKTTQHLVLARVNRYDKEKAGQQVHIEPESNAFLTPM